ncbi:hypothetical protein JGU71_29180 [Antrihabitans sp. YC3-6]|uniref:Uncharacterized protein n=1 Tax=Antrihabitans stalagmiti TaxID=2799499 RepID=A0A934NXD5_9NOCA|nr:hypothetical protein [Antrihabitans stalagmiti]MBJ8342967.1 hypothetical protein [Antrihabitans stalagmiti]
MTGEATHKIIQRFPDEEEFESLAARIRPLILQNEWLRWTNVITALRTSVDQQQLEEIAEPLKWWHAEWVKVAENPGDMGAQAFYSVTEDGTVTDLQLMWAWLYSDLVHAHKLDAKFAKYGIGDRFRASTGVIARIVWMVEKTYYLVAALHEEGLLSISPEMFERSVTVPEPDLSQIGRIYVAPVGTPPPIGLEAFGPEWQEVHEVIRPAGSR